MVDDEINWSVGKKLLEQVIVSYLHDRECIVSIGNHES